jgi:hypothetical protein
LVVIARFRDGRPVMRGGTDHTSHRLAARGLTHARVALLAIAAQAACSILAVGLFLASNGTVVVGTIAATALAGGALLATLRLEHPRAPTAEVGPDDLIEIPAENLPEFPSAAVDGLGILNIREDLLDG